MVVSDAIEYMISMDTKCCRSKLTSLNNNYFSPIGMLCYIELDLLSLISYTI